MPTDLLTFVSSGTMEVTESRNMLFRLAMGIYLAFIELSRGRTRKLHKTTAGSEPEEGRIDLQFGEMAGGRLSIFIMVSIFKVWDVAGKLDADHDWILGLLMNSEVWVCLIDKKQCLPFVLAELGYDVWVST